MKSGNSRPDPKKLHFIGIGGIGMSALAQFFLKEGARVSGSDIKESHITDKLQRLGAEVFIGHRKGNLPRDANSVIYSSCITQDNPEMLDARRKSIPVVPRGKLLAELMREKVGVAVAGSHGKTTTAFLILAILVEAGLEPTALIGGEAFSLGGNAHIGKGPYLVTEADESDGSFRHLEPTYSVITNIDVDHLDFYKTKDGILKAFRDFIGKIKAGGALFCWAEEPNLKDLLNGYKGRTATFGLSNEAEIQAREIKADGGNCRFKCIYRGQKLGMIELPLPGIHNCLNSLGAIGVALELGVGFNQVSKALVNFGGIQRRFQIRGKFAEITVVEDYAHHPAEIMATLEAARTWNPDRIVVVFQPHRFTRTMHLKEEFGKSFALADHLVLTDIYEAWERPIEGVTGKVLFEKVIESGHRDVVYLPMKEIAEHIVGFVRAGDMVMVLGAGDINRVAGEVVEGLRQRVGSSKVQMGATDVKAKGARL